MDQVGKEECDPKFDEQPSDAVGELELVNEKVAVGGEELNEKMTYWPLSINFGEDLRVGNPGAKIV